jgi:hypothetical protein
VTDEPTKFGSIIRATHLGTSRLFQMAPTVGKHYWEDEDGLVEVWSEFSDAEIVRIGIDDDDLTAAEFDRLLAAGTPVTAPVDPAAFCTRNRNCRMSDGHDGGCQP